VYLEGVLVMQSLEVFGLITRLFLKVAVQLMRIDIVNHFFLEFQVCNGSSDLPFEINFLWIL